MSTEPLVALLGMYTTHHTHPLYVLSVVHQDEEEEDEAKSVTDVKPSVSLSLVTQRETAWHRRHHCSQIAHYPACRRAQTAQTSEKRPCFLSSKLGHVCVVTMVTVVAMMLAAHDSNKSTVFGSNVVVKLVLLTLQF